jgi:pyroglutamyl-peptidase
MRTLLVTGFGSFPGAPLNPSAEIVALLRRDWRARFSRLGVRLATAVLPVVHDIAPHIDALVARERPDAVVHLGLAGSRRRVCVETLARNRVSSLKPDARGRFVNAPVHALGERPRRSRWNAGRLAAALRGRGIDAVLSDNAGDYVCNAALWHSLRPGAVPSIFIHVPKKRRVAPARLAAALAQVLASKMPVAGEAHSEQQ